MKRVFSILLFIPIIFNSNAQKDAIVYSFVPPALEVGAITVVPMFYTGSCLCRPGGETYFLIDSIAKFLNANQNIVVAIEYHTDHRGNDISNWKFSQQHPTNLMYEIMRRGIDSSQLVPIGKGESEPWIVTKQDVMKHPFLKEGTKLNEKFIGQLPDEQKQICYALNRRTVLRVLEIKK